MPLVMTHIIREWRHHDSWVRCGLVILKYRKRVEDFLQAFISCVCCHVITRIQIFKGPIWVTLRFNFDFLWKIWSNLVEFRLRFFYWNQRYHFSEKSIYRKDLRRRFKNCQILILYSPKQHESQNGKYRRTFSPSASNES